MSTPRLEKLLTLHAKDPADAFVLFAIGMEHKKLRHTADAVDWFAKALQANPNYCVAYHQMALAWEDAGDLEAARNVYRQGIAVANACGDPHAAQEMQAALSLIE